MIQQLSQAIGGGHYSAPKTILGFLGVIVLIVATFALGAIIALAGNHDLHWLILPILAFVGLGVVVLVGIVLRLAQKDPTPLVLGEMTGEDWIAHKRLVMGDSLRGERIESPIQPGEEEPPAEAEDPLELPRHTGEGG